MTARKSRATTPVEAAPESIIFGPDNGGNVILAAWQGLYHLFGARVERFDIDNSGVTAIGFTLDEKWGTPESIVNTISHSEKFPYRRLDLIPMFSWAQGEVPAPFTTSLQLTGWVTSNLKSGKGRSPAFAKTAVQEYKTNIGLAVPRGRPRKTIRLTELGTLDKSALDGIELTELTKLQEVLNGVLSSEETVTA